MIFPTSRIDAAIPEKLDPKGELCGCAAAEEQQQSAVVPQQQQDGGTRGGCSAGKCFDRPRPRPPNGGGVACGDPLRSCNKKWKEEGGVGRTSPSRIELLSQIFSFFFFGGEKNV